MKLSLRAAGLAVATLTLAALILPGSAGAKPWWMRGVESNEGDFLDPDVAFRAGSRVDGKSNREAAATADVVVLTVPATGLQTTLPELRDVCRGKVVVSTVVPLTFGGGRLFTPPPQGSAAEEAQEILGPEARVVASFHHIAAHELAAGDHAIECDLLLCGGDAPAKKLVTELGASMGLRAVDVGPLTNAGPLEGITAVLATINRRYKLKNSGIKITGLP